MNVPEEFKQKYIDILFKHQAAISVNKMDLGHAKNFAHKIHLKDNNPVYRKQFKIPEAHQNFIEATLDEWLKLGVVKRSNSLYNLPLFCVPKKQGQGLRIVQDEHLQVLEKVFERLHQNHIKVYLDKCVFGNREVSYLGFMLTPKGIKPGQNTLQAIQDAKPPANIKMVRSSIGLCNFFHTHIKDFAIIAAPLFMVTRKDSGYKNGPLPPDALHAFKVLQQQLTLDPVMAFPWSDRKYALITDAATGTADFSCGLGAILMQVDNNGNHYAISFASRQLKYHEKNYSPFLLEAAAAVWGMEVFNEYLRGKQFILFTDHKPLEKLGHLHTKMLNQLQTALLEHDFIVQYKK